jgi:predicted Fe-Mo cluster-binding NifX family protein
LLEAKSFLPNADVSVVLIGSHDRTPLPMLRKAGVKVVDAYRDLQV